jgi:hypothetical protein
MKKFTFLFAAFLISIFINAQDFPQNINGNIEFSEVVPTTLNKNVLHANAKEWVAKTFGDYKRVLQFEDNENCKLIIKGLSNIEYAYGIPGMATTEDISYTITIESKDGKYRYTFDNVLVNQTLTVLGTSVHPKPFPPTDHKQNIDKYNKELTDLKLIDESSLKKKALKEHQEKISKLQKNIIDESICYQQEYEAIIRIINSLKQAMQTNDDF